MRAHARNTLETATAGYLDEDHSGYLPVSPDSSSSDTGRVLVVYLVDSLAMPGDCDSKNPTQRLPGVTPESLGVRMHWTSTAWHSRLLEGGANRSHRADKEACILTWSSRWLRTCIDAASVN